MSTPDKPYSRYPFGDPFGFWRAMAPQTLNQPILPGLFGITINTANSSSPETEQRIVARDSYGRQLGRLMDAMALMIEQSVSDETRMPKAYAELLELKARIDETKEETREDRLKRIGNDLDSLKTSDLEAYKTLISARAKSLR